MTLSPKFDEKLAASKAIPVFLAFAFAYFLSNVVRAITATLSPTLTLELGLQARDLGLLSGGYFLGFAAMQLPLGKWLDRHGPKKVILAFLSVAVLGFLAFAWSSSFYGLLAARVLIGAGVSACLMAPLTGYRRWFDASTQLRVTSWMLMTGSMGMIAATLPVQWLMPIIGWRGIFIALAAMVIIAICVIQVIVPSWASASNSASTTSSSITASTSAQPSATRQGYAVVWENAYFRSLVPMGFFCYGGLMAVQTLWAVPWMIKAAGYTPQQATTGLFWVNIAMLFTFWMWGAITPWLARRAVDKNKLMIRGMPLSFIVLAIIIVAVNPLNTSVNVAFLWVLYFMACSFVSLTQTAVGLAFPPEQTGRAMSAYNLVLFVGVFVVQWGIGLMVDGFKLLGWAEVAAFQGAFAVFLACCIASYGYFVVKRPQK